MELKLKPIHESAIPRALAKAEVYRNLHEPEEAESICRDILAVDPHHQLALRLLGLSLTDQFTGESSDRYSEVDSVFGKLTDPYEMHYYMGLLFERRAKAQLSAGRSPHTLLPLFEAALRCFAEAEKLRPADNDDAILRWNRCVRILQSHPEFEAEKESLLFEPHDSPPV